MELSRDDSQKLCLVGLPCIIAWMDKPSITSTMVMTAGILTMKLPLRSLPICEVYPGVCAGALFSCPKHDNQ